MLFSSNIFLLYFLPAFLLAYFLVPRSWRNPVLLLFSIFFYAWGAPDFVLVLMGATVASFYLVRAMDRAATTRTKKLLCGATILVNLGLLAYFKYANFFVDNFNALLSIAGHEPMAWTRVLLPIGISFFSFQSVTYAVDTYRGINKPMERLTDYMLYIMMFPQLIAGPIVRYTDIADQITHRELSYHEALQGFYRFVIGLAKKVLVADVLGRWVDTMMGGNIATWDTGTAWVTIVAYTMQLYFDFSGYSDMAIGLGRMMGFRFPENFNNPYVSSSITEFWRRWHITLGAFMKNYLYIPLGGNRKGVGRTYFNLWIVFLLSGLWHGASWNFVLWGAYHGTFLVIERLLQKLRKGAVPQEERLLRRLPKVLLTFFIATVGWSLFRIEDLPTCWTFITRLFAFDFHDFDPQITAQTATTLVVALIFAFLTLFSFGRKLEQKVFYNDCHDRTHIPIWIVAVLLFFLCLAALNASGFSPFIYFRF